MIVSEQHWHEQDRTVERNIVVAEGGSLTIEDSVLDLRIEAICTPVQLNGQYCKPEIEVHEGGELVVANSTLSSSFEDGRQWSHLRATGGNLTIQDSDLSRLGSVRAEFGGHMIFEDNTVHGAIGEVGIWRAAEGVVADNSFGERTHGVGVQDASPEIHNNTFHNVSGFSVRVQQTVVGDKAGFTTAPQIVDNVFESPDQGIFTDSGAGLVIAHNRFEDARWQGVNLRIPTQDDHFRMLDREPPRIEANVFVDGLRAVKAQTVARDTTETASRLQVTGNVILDQECDLIDADEAPGAPLTVDARYNWWGTTEGPSEPDRADEEPSCNPFDGSASFETRPWLQAPPATAGPRTGT